MKKTKLYTSIMIILSLCILVSCQSKEEKQALNLEESSWEEIAEHANGQTVSMYMWGGSEVVNNYMDKYVIPEMKNQYNINLKKVPITDIADTINQLMAEKEIQKDQGSADIIWINGENFKNAKENTLLLENIAEKIPNYTKYCNTKSESNTLDFGLKTDGDEVPWGQSQFVFTYNEKYIKNPPKNMEELKQFVITNPGKFTYPAPPDFVGSAFVRMAVYEQTGGYEQYLEELTKSEIEELIKPAWKYLNEIKPYLWRAGATYPESSGKLDQLYANEEVWMTMSYNPLHSEAMVKTGQFPETTKTFLLENGTLSNTHFLAIPYNSAKKEGALMTINFLLSSDAQLKKMDSKYWGDQMVIDVDKMTEKEKIEYKRLTTSEITLSSEILKKHALPEMRARYIQFLETGWIDNVVKN